ncbi:MAG: thermonuclease family protein [Myxococcaceae bacterium]
MSVRFGFSCALLLLCGCGSSSVCGPTTGDVENVVDGDTIQLTTGEKIRYLLVDTPEITNGHNDCYGAEARDFNRSLVDAKTVSLQYDEAQCKDRFGRLLAYVSVDGHEVNKLLVERGFACVLSIPPAGDARKDEFLSTQTTAKSEGRGVWGFCDPVPCQ